MLSRRPEVQRSVYRSMTVSTSIPQNHVSISNVPEDNCRTGGYYSTYNAQYVMGTGVGRDFRTTSCAECARPFPPFCLDLWPSSMWQNNTKFELKRTKLNVTSSELDSRLLLALRATFEMPISSCHRPTIACHSQRPERRSGYCLLLGTWQYCSIP